MMINGLSELLRQFEKQWIEHDESNVDTDEDDALLWLLAPARFLLMQFSNLNALAQKTPDPVFLEFMKDVHPQSFLGILPKMASWIAKSIPLTRSKIPSVMKWMLLGLRAVNITRQNSYSEDPVDSIGASISLQMDLTYFSAMFVLVVHLISVESNETDILEESYLILFDTDKTVYSSTQRLPEPMRTYESDFKNNIKIPIKSNIGANGGHLQNQQQLLKFLAVTMEREVVQRYADESLIPTIKQRYKMIGKGMQQQINTMVGWTESAPTANFALFPVLLRPILNPASAKEFVNSVGSGFKHNIEQACTYLRSIMPEIERLSDTVRQDFHANIKRVGVKISRFCELLLIHDRRDNVIEEMLTLSRVLRSDLFKGFRQWIWTAHGWSEAMRLDSKNPKQRLSLMIIARGFAIPIYEDKLNGLSSMEGDEIATTKAQIGQKAILRNNLNIEIMENTNSVFTFEQWVVKWFVIHKGRMRDPMYTRVEIILQGMRMEWVKTMQKPWTQKYMRRYADSAQLTKMREMASFIKKRLQGWNAWVMPKANLNQIIKERMKMEQKLGVIGNSNVYPNEYEEKGVNINTLMRNINRFFISPEVDEEADATVDLGGLIKEFNKLSRNVKDITREDILPDWIKPVAFSSPQRLDDISVIDIMEQDFTEIVRLLGLNLKEEVTDMKFNQWGHGQQKEPRYRGFLSWGERVLETIHAEQSMLLKIADHHTLLDENERYLYLWQRGRAAHSNVGDDNRDSFQERFDRIERAFAYFDENDPCLYLQPEREIFSNIPVPVVLPSKKKKKTKKAKKTAGSVPIRPLKNRAVFLTPAFEAIILSISDFLDWAYDRRNAKFFTSIGHLEKLIFSPLIRLYVQSMQTLRLKGSGINQQQARSSSRMIEITSSVLQLELQNWKQFSDYSMEYHSTVYKAYEMHAARNRSVSFAYQGSRILKGADPFAGFRDIQHQEVMNKNLGKGALTYLLNMRSPEELMWSLGSNRDAKLAQEYIDYENAQNHRIKISAVLDRVLKDERSSGNVKWKRVITDIRSSLLLALVSGGVASLSLYSTQFLYDAFHRNTDIAEIGVLDIISSNWSSMFRERVWAKVYNKDIIKKDGLLHTRAANLKKDVIERVKRLFIHKGKDATSAEQNATGFWNRLNLYKNTTRAESINQQKSNTNIANRQLIELVAASGDVSRIIHTDMSVIETQPLVFQLAVGMVYPKKDGKFVQVTTDDVRGWKEEMRMNTVTLNQLNERFPDAVLKDIDEKKGGIIVEAETEGNEEDGILGDKDVFTKDDYQKTPFDRAMNFGILKAVKKVTTSLYKKIAKGPLQRAIAKVISAIFSRDSPIVEESTSDLFDPIGISGLERERQRLLASILVQPTDHTKQLIVDILKNTNVRVWEDIGDLSQKYILVYNLALSMTRHELDIEKDQEMKMTAAWWATTKQGRPIPGTQTSQTPPKVYPPRRFSWKRSRMERLRTVIVEQDRRLKNYRAQIHKTVRGGNFGEKGAFFTEIMPRIANMFIDQGIPILIKWLFKRVYKPVFKLGDTTLISAGKGLAAGIQGISKSALIFTAKEAAIGTIRFWEVTMMRRAYIIADTFRQEGVHIGGFVQGMRIILETSLAVAMEALSQYTTSDKLAEITSSIIGTIVPPIKAFAMPIKAIGSVISDLVFPGIGPGASTQIKVRQYVDWALTKTTGEHINIPELINKGSAPLVQHIFVKWYRERTRPYVMRGGIQYRPQLSGKDIFRRWESESFAHLDPFEKVTFMPAPKPQRSLTKNFRRFFRGPLPEDELYNKGQERKSQIVAQRERAVITNANMRKREFERNKKVDEERFNRWLNRRTIEADYLEAKAENEVNEELKKRLVVITLNSNPDAYVRKFVMSPLRLRFGKRKREIKRQEKGGIIAKKRRKRKTTTVVNVMEDLQMIRQKKTAIELLALLIEEGEYLVRKQLKASTPPLRLILLHLITLSFPGESMAPANMDKFHAMAMSDYKEYNINNVRQRINAENDENDAVHKARVINEIFKVMHLNEFAFKIVDWIFSAYKIHFKAKYVTKTQTPIQILTEELKAEQKNARRKLQMMIRDINRARRKKAASTKILLKTPTTWAGEQIIKNPSMFKTQNSKIWALSRIVEEESGQFGLLSFLIRKQTEFQTMKTIGKAKWDRFMDEPDVPSSIKTDLQKRQRQRQLGEIVKRNEQVENELVYVRLKLRAIWMAQKEKKLPSEYDITETEVVEIHTTTPLLPPPPPPPSIISTDEGVVVVPIIGRICNLIGGKGFKEQKTARSFESLFNASFNDEGSKMTKIQMPLSMGTGDVEKAVAALSLDLKTKQHKTKRPSKRNQMQAVLFVKNVAEYRNTFRMYVALLHTQEFDIVRPTLGMLTDKEMDTLGVDFDYLQRTLPPTIPLWGLRDALAHPWVITQLYLISPITKKTRQVIAQIDDAIQSQRELMKRSEENDVQGLADYQKDRPIIIPSTIGNIIPTVSVPNELNRLDGLKQEPFYSNMIHFVRERRPHDAYRVLQGIANLDHNKRRVVAGSIVQRRYLSRNPVVFGIPANTNMMDELRDKRNKIIEKIKMRILNSQVKFKKFRFFKSKKNTKSLIGSSIITTNDVWVDDVSQKLDKRWKGDVVTRADVGIYEAQKHTAVTSNRMKRLGRLVFAHASGRDKAPRFFRRWLKNRIYYGETQLRTGLWDDPVYLLIPDHILHRSQIAVRLFDPSLSGELEDASYEARVKDLVENSRLTFAIGAESSSYRVVKSHYVVNNLSNLNVFIFQTQNGLITCVFDGWPHFREKGEMHTTSMSDMKLCLYKRTFKELLEKGFLDPAIILFQGAVKDAGQSVGDVLLGSLSIAIEVVLDGRVDTGDFDDIMLMPLLVASALCLVIDTTISSPSKMIVERVTDIITLFLTSSTYKIWNKVERRFAPTDEERGFLSRLRKDKILLGKDSLIHLFRALEDSFLSGIFSARMTVFPELRSVVINRPQAVIIFDIMEGPWTMFLDAKNLDEICCYRQPLSRHLLECAMLSYDYDNDNDRQVFVDAAVFGDRDMLIACKEMIVGKVIQK